MHASRSNAIACMLCSIAILAWVNWTEYRGKIRSGFPILITKSLTHDTEKL